MEKMTFREAQLLAKGAGAKGRVIPEGMQLIPIGDELEIVEICLDKPCVVVRFGDDGPGSYCHIDNFSDAIKDEVIGLLREVAFELDYVTQKK